MWKNRNSHHTAWFCIILSVVFIVTDSSKTLSRDKRFIIWRQGLSRLQVIVGFGIPLDLELETVIIGYIMKANYQLPTNASDWFPNVFYSRKKRSLSRWNIYEMLGQAAQMRGFGDGKSCVLRAICELSHIPIEKNHGLYDELAHMIFNPDTTKEDITHHSHQDYFSAQNIGRKVGHLCPTFYPACEASLLEMFTM